MDGAAAEAEAGASCGQPRGGVVAGTSLPALAQVGAGGEWGALQAALGDVVAGHVQQLVGSLGQRQDGSDLVDDDRGQVLPAVGLALVAHPGAQAQQAAGLQAQLGAQAEGMDLVNGLGGDDLDRACWAGLCAVGVGDVAGVRAEGGAVRAVQEHTWARGPGLGGQGEDGQVVGDPGGVGAQRGALGPLDVVEGRGRQVTEVGAPVAHDRQPVREEVEDHAGPAVAQVEGHHRPSKDATV